MRARRFIQYGALGGLVLSGLACAGNSARTEDTAVARDTTARQDTSAYRSMIRDTAAAGLSDSAKWSRANPSTSEVKPGESTGGKESTSGADSTRVNIDTVPTTSDTTTQ
jgi:hypothetical protein